MSARVQKLPVGTRVNIIGVRALAGHTGTVVATPEPYDATAAQWQVWVDLDHEDYQTEIAPGIGFGPLGFYLHEIEVITS